MQDVGRGQASIGLSDYFKKVLANDISSEQIRNADLRGNIRYISCPSENIRIKNNSVDVIVCAQSLHWFDLEKFCNEVKRVSKPNGILAALTYNLFRVNTEIDDLIDKFYYEIIYNYWPEERRHVENGYKEIMLPFIHIEAPSFSMTAQWNLQQLLGYLNTWSGVSNYMELEAFNPIEFVEKDLNKLWGIDKSEIKNIE